MTEHIVKNNQNIIDIVMMTYGSQEALFKLTVDNNLTQIPFEFVPGTKVQYDKSDILFDINIYKIRQNEIGEVATTNNSLLARGSYNRSFNLSFN